MNRKKIKPRDEILNDRNFVAAARVLPFNKIFFSVYEIRFVEFLI